MKKKWNAPQSVCRPGVRHAGFRPGSTSRNEGACRRLLDEIGDRHSRLDVLVNNAAILDASPIGDLTVERFREVTRVNLDGALVCTLAALPLMERTGGRILMTASIMGLVGSPDSLPYSSAKGGIVNMVRALACDLAPKGITVNAIAPGFIDTRMARAPDGSHEHETDYFRTVYLGYRKRSRSGEPAIRTTSQARPPFWCPRMPPTSPARSSPSTAASPRPSEPSATHFKTTVGRKAMNVIEATRTGDPPDELDPRERMSELIDLRRTVVPRSG